MVYSPNTTINASSTSSSSATATGSAEIPSGHFAYAEAETLLQADSEPPASGALEGYQSAFRTTLSSQTFAESWWNGPLFSTAATSNDASITGLQITLGPDSKLAVTWDIDAIGIQSAPSTGLATVEHMESITLTNTSRLKLETISFSYGYRAISINGETSWTAFDFPGSSTISGFLTEVLGAGQSRLSPSIHSEVGALALAELMPELLDGSEQVSVNYEITHSEYSAEAPLAAVAPVGELTGSKPSAALAYWQASTGQLVFDPWPLDEILDARGVSVAGSAAEELLQGSHLELDPIVSTGAPGEGYFMGTGALRLVSADGVVLLEAPIPGLIFDTRLSDSIEFNLFSPLLRLDVNPEIDSTWLKAFTHRLESDESHIPELFIEIDTPLAVRWDTDFVTPARAALSFAGPAISVDIGNSLLLFLAGILAGLATQYPRGCRERASTPRLVKGDKVASQWPQ